jgi:hypothetical protein
MFAGFLGVPKGANKVRAELGCKSKLTEHQRKVGIPRARRAWSRASQMVVEVMEAGERSLG